MLGHDVKKVFFDSELISFSRREFDITNIDSTLAAVREHKPDFLIHAAAYTDVDGSELDPQQAYRVNSIGTRNVTMACEEYNCPVIYISSDYVFNGSGNKPYDEWDRPDPINKYGLSKLLGEEFVTTLTNKFYIVRTSWLYGRNGKNFVDTIARLLKEKEEIDVVDDQIGAPTSTYDLALKLRELIGRGYGTYHISNSSSCSWYEFALEIARLENSKSRVKPVTSAQFKRPAPRPAYSLLGNTMLKLEGLEELRHWKDALQNYLSAG